ncbi:hypothetical protein LS68_006555 [Helicobacter sp. MIT 05-5293]|uniref:DUF1796 family putative cysteine peptidase n=1 Tax=Helicobacter sp. MIT 05-5293 TaxID=1548149 RepID=UPI0010FDDA5E|nr:DUF1796 family putative cysteine peptidase [Helicobacter sp. MIT 05-5293]TLD80414.1 hypothetical protein LS68_006555 [Helicobacter sp. MIT 05-5293]
MQEQTPFQSKTLQNISKITTHWIPIARYRRKARNALYHKINLSFNQWLLSQYRKQHQEELLNVDMAVSLGDACIAAHYLQKFGLREFASPFDWMMCYTLKDIQNLLANDFEGFFVDIQDKEGFDANNHCRHITDMRNGMVSIHTFRKDRSIASQYPLFIETMRRRFNNLISHIRQSRHILFVTTRRHDQESFNEFLSFMSKYHDAHYTILNITNAKETTDSILSPAQRSVIKLNAKLTIIEYSFVNTFPHYEVLQSLLGNNTKVTGGGGVA